MPWHTPQHWSLLIVNNFDYYYFDPLYVALKPTKQIQDFIQLFSKVFKKTIVEKNMKIPKQSDVWSCGYRILVVVYNNYNNVFF